MTDSNNHPSASKSPSHTAYVVRKNKDGENLWIPVGAAWAHKDGEGFNIEVDLITSAFSLTLRKPKAKK